MPDAALSPHLKQATGVVVARGEGAWVEDASGRRFLDFTSGIGVLNTGHSHPTVVAAAHRQIERFVHAQYTTVLHEPLLELTRRLGERMPPGLDRAFYASAGTEAVEAGIRLARHATGRTNIVAFSGGFHGRTAGSLALTSSRVTYRAGLQPLMGGVFFAPFPHAFRLGLTPAEATSRALDGLDEVFETLSAPEETAAVIVEPVLGEGGYVPATPGFLEGVRERTAAHGILLILDEIQAGIGRTGRFWGHEHAAIVPDAIVTAKGLASGFPLSALWAPEEIMARAWPGSQGGTYGGNAVACAAAIATLEVIESEQLVHRAERRGAVLLARLREITAGSPLVGDVRGIGLMVATEFSAWNGVAGSALAAAVRRAMERRGVLMLTCGPQGEVLRWIPPLIVSEEEIEHAIHVFGESLEAVRSGRDTEEMKSA